MRPRLKSNPLQNYAIKKIAVENFLNSIDTTVPDYLHRMNALSDAKIYKWNSETLNAILKGITKAYKRKVA